MFVFVSNTPIDQYGTTGFLGLGICPPAIAQDYSFRYNLAQEIVRQNTSATEEDIEEAFVSSLEWVMNTTAGNVGDPFEPNGFLYINHGSVQSE